MSGLLLDTHAWVWSFSDGTRLSSAARAAILEADAVYVSPISFFEIGQKVRIGKWPEMVGRAPDLPQILVDQGGIQAPLTAEICIDAGLWDWPHRDPFDRLIAATARVLDLSLVSCDTVFAGLDDLTLLW